jgi:hypothetical protein
LEPFTTYEAYLDRYKTYYNEEGDERPPVLSAQEFTEQFQLLHNSYQAYYDLIQMGHTDQAARYYVNVINQLEDQLAIADGSNNFGQEIFLP